MDKWYYESESTGARICAVILALLVTSVTVSVVVRIVHNPNRTLLGWLLLSGFTALFALTALYWWTQAFIPAWYKEPSGKRASYSLLSIWFALLVSAYAIPLFQKSTYNRTYELMSYAAPTLILVSTLVGFLRKLRSGE
jgi:hypothetical protein